MNEVAPDRSCCFGNDGYQPDFLNSLIDRLMNESGAGTCHVRRVFRKMIMGVSFETASLRKWLCGEKGDVMMRQVRQKPREWGLWRSRGSA